jgi:NAD(P)-dependent dehydrogenase (short-subunit alcohol dehydrogenase family)
MNTGLAGQRAVVTAGAGGAGLVIAKTLAREGAQVFVGDVDSHAIDELPSNLIGTVVDVAEPVAVQNWLAPIVAESVDILVNNAGVAGPTKPIEEITPEEWRRCLAVGLDSQYLCTRAVIPAMKRVGSGSIINIASTAGYLGMPYRAPYVAAKFGVVGLTKTLAMELGRDGIRVNAIAPGSIVGDRMDQVVAAQAKADDVTIEEVEMMYTQSVSLARFVEPEEIADMVVYLCSRQARSISGQVIGVDGNTETLYPRPLRDADN